jgi:hypothetical protein
MIPPLAIFYSKLKLVIGGSVRKSNENFVDGVRCKVSEEIFFKTG